MRAYLVVVFHVRQQYVPKMSFAQDDNMIGTFPADRTDQPFSISVLPWGARRRWPITNTVCTENLNLDIVVMKPTKDRV